MTSRYSAGQALVALAALATIVAACGRNGPTETRQPLPPFAIPNAFLEVAIERLPVYASEADQQPYLGLGDGALIQLLDVGSSTRVKIQHFDTVEGSQVVWADIVNVTRPNVRRAGLAPCPVPSDPRMLGGVTDGERLSCFAGRALTFMSVQFRTTDVVRRYSGEPQWLAQLPETSITEGPDWTDLAVHVLPDVTVPRSDRWVTITGSFDYVESVSCLRTPLDETDPPVSPADAALWCRQRFVVVRIDPAPPRAEETPPTDLDTP